MAELITYAPIGEAEKWGLDTYINTWHRVNETALDYPRRILVCKQQQQQLPTASSVRRHFDKFRNHELYLVSIYFSRCNKSLIRIKCNCRRFGGIKNLWNFPSYFRLKITSSLNFSLLFYSASKSLLWALHWWAYLKIMSHILARNQ